MGLVGYRFAVSAVEFVVGTVLEQGLLHLPVLHQLPDLLLDVFLAIAVKFGLDGLPVQVFPTVF